MRAGFDVRAKMSRIFDIFPQKSRLFGPNFYESRGVLHVSPRVKLGREVHFGGLSASPVVSPASLPQGAGSAPDPLPPAFLLLCNGGGHQYREPTVARAPLSVGAVNNIAAVFGSVEDVVLEGELA